MSAGRKRGAGALLAAVMLAGAALADTGVMSVETANPAPAATAVAEAAEPPAAETAETTATAPAETVSPENSLEEAKSETTAAIAATAEPPAPDGQTERDAVDISDHCAYNGRPGGPKHVLNDGAYNYSFATGPRAGVHSIDITVTEGEAMGALYIQWDGDPVAVAVQVRPDGENWETVAESEGIFFAEYISFPACRECRLVGRDNRMTQLRIAEMRVLTPGRPAPEIQIWEKPEGKVDLMLIAGHPDDELIWFGGALPYYAGELGKRTVVITCAASANLRRLELCDALWACGVRVHPIYLHRLDFSDTNIRTVLRKWHGQDEVLTWIIRYIRQLKPDVLLLQDVNGEYGHGIHKAACWLGQQAVPGAADAAVDPDSAAACGTWRVKKTYIHLWQENQIHMDWKQPLEAFGGKTGLEAAQEALEKHKSQVVHGWKIVDGGEYDNALFGLYDTAVGPDVEKNDFFEHID